MLLCFFNNHRSTISQYFGNARHYFIGIVSHINNGIWLLALPRVGSSGRKHPFVFSQSSEKGKAFMDDNFLNINEVKEVAKTCLMSEYHFFRCFRQAYHITPIQYLTDKRLEYAKHLLNNPELTIANIAYIANYPDVFTFSKAFKKKYGASPPFFRIKMDQKHS